jgi:hypothetical protein
MKNLLSLPNFAKPSGVLKAIHRVKVVSRRVNQWSRSLYNDDALSVRYNSLGIPEAVEPNEKYRFTGGGYVVVWKDRLLRPGFSTFYVERLSQNPVNLGEVAGSKRFALDLRPEAQDRLDMDAAKGL